MLHTDSTELMSEMVIEMLGTEEIWNSTQEKA